LSPRVVDCFPFFNELDVLELRLAELEPVVDRFVAVEARQTHRGDAKPLHLSESIERFAQYADKLDVVVIDLVDDPDPWVRENQQREAIASALDDEDDDAVVMVSDVDELPDRSVVRHLELPGPGEVIALDMSLRYYALNWELAGGWDLARAASAATVRALGPQRLREAVPDRTLAAAGWHLSCLYREDRRVPSIIDKATSFAHAELDHPKYLDPGYLDACVTYGFCWSDAPRFSNRLRWVSLEDSAPVAVREDPDRWQPFTVARPRFHPFWEAVAVGGRARASVWHRSRTIAAALHR